MQLAFLLVVVGILVAGPVFWYIVLPRSHRKGATADEVKGTLPGDGLVPNPKTGYTQAITINAAPEQVWPWLAQHGYMRAGFYSHEWVYKLMGSNDYYEGTRSAERIIPELQDLKVGDQIKINDDSPFEVITLEPTQILALLARSDLRTGEYFELSEPLPTKYMNQSWVYVLREIDENTTRLIVRWRGDYSPGFANSLFFGMSVEAGALLMQYKMLKGIKERAEGQSE
jgi:hypothetical protein